MNSHQEWWAAVSIRFCRRLFDALPSAKYFVVDTPIKCQNESWTIAIRFHIKALCYKDIEEMSHWMWFVRCLCDDCVDAFSHAGIGDFRLRAMRNQLSNSPWNRIVFVKSGIFLIFDKTCTVCNEQQTYASLCFISRLTSRNIMRCKNEILCAGCAKWYAYRADIGGRFEPCSALIRIVDVMVNGKCS